MLLLNCSGDLVSETVREVDYYHYDGSPAEKYKVEMAKIQTEIQKNRLRSSYVQFVPGF